MNGAMADPWVSTIRPPNKTKTTMIGNSQYFFLTFKNSQNSIKKDIFKDYKFTYLFKTDFSYYFYNQIFQSN